MVVVEVVLELVRGLVVAATRVEWVREPAVVLVVVQVEWVREPAVVLVVVWVEWVLVAVEVKVELVRGPKWVQLASAARLVPVARQAIARLAIARLAIAK